MIFARRRWGAVLGALLLSLSSSLFADAPRLFERGGYAAILEAHRGAPLLMVFWSIDCPPCREELAMLGEMRKGHPDFPLVLVSTDDPAQLVDISAALAEAAVDGAESWVFAADQAQRLRFEVDRRWYGELPRSYFFDAGHQRRGVTGRLSEEQVARWYQTVMR